MTTVTNNTTLKSGKNQRGVTLVFIVVLIVMLLLLSLIWLMVAKQTKTISENVGNRHIEEVAPSGVGRLLTMLRADMIGQDDVFLNADHIPMNPTGADYQMIDLNDPAAPNHEDDARYQYAEIANPATDEIYDFPWTNDDREKYYNASGRGMFDDQWLASTMPELNSQGLYYWRHMSDIRRGFVDLNLFKVREDTNPLPIAALDGTPKPAEVPPPPPEPVAPQEPLPQDYYTYDASGAPIKVGEDYVLEPQYAIDYGNYLTDKATYDADYAIWKPLNDAYEKYLSELADWNKKIKGHLDPNDPDGHLRPLYGAQTESWLGNVGPYRRVENVPGFPTNVIPDPRADGRYNQTTGSETGADLPDDIQDFELFYPDADGDGIPDSRWTWAPLQQVQGIRYVMAVRVVDLSAMLNINVHTSVGGTPSSVRWESPASIDLSRALTANGSSSAALGGGIPSTHWNNIVTATGGTDYGYPASPNFGAIDEMVMRYRFTQRSDTLASKLTNTHERYGTGGSGDVSHISDFDSSVTLKDAIDDIYNIDKNIRPFLTAFSGSGAYAPVVTFNNTGGDYYTVDASQDTFTNATIKRVLKRDINTLNHQELYNEVRRVFGLENGGTWYTGQWDKSKQSLAAMPDPFTPYEVPSWFARIQPEPTMGTPDDIARTKADTFAWHIVANLLDYKDDDNANGSPAINAVTVINETSDSGEAITAAGFEKLPAITEVYVQQPYLITAVTASSGDNYTVDVDKVNYHAGVVVEIRNPFTTSIPVNGVYLKLSGNGAEELVNLGDLAPGGWGVNKLMPAGEIWFLYMDTFADTVNAAIMMSTVLQGLTNGVTTDLSMDPAAIDSMIQGGSLNFKAALHYTTESVSGDSFARAEWPYQEIDVTDASATDYTIADNYSGIDINYPTGDPTAVSTYLYKCFSVIGNGEGWKMLAMQGPDAPAGSGPKFVRETIDQGNPALPMLYDNGIHALGKETESNSAADNYKGRLWGSSNRVVEDDNDGSPDNEFYLQDEQTPVKAKYDQIVIPDRNHIAHVGELLNLSLLGAGPEGDITEAWEGLVNDLTYDPSDNKYLDLSNFRLDVYGDRTNSGGAVLVNPRPDYPTAHPVPSVDEGSRRIFDGGNTNVHQVPPAVFLMSRFSTYSPQSDGVDNDGDGLVDAADVDELFIPGTLNINTVSEQLLAYALPIDASLDYRRFLARLVVLYRNNDFVWYNNSTGRIELDVDSLVDPAGKLVRVRELVISKNNIEVDVLPDNWRERPGVAHLAELAPFIGSIHRAMQLGILVGAEVPSSTAGGEYITFLSVDANSDGYFEVTGVPGADGSDNYSLPTGNVTLSTAPSPVYATSPADNFNGGGTPDEISDDWLEQTAPVRWIMQTCAVRSEFYVAYILIRGFEYDMVSTSDNRIRDFRALVEEKRFGVLLQRSHITQASDPVKILAVWPN